MGQRNKLLHSDGDSDPMGVVANLFDVAMVFAVALMVALVTRFNMTELFSKEDFSLVKNPGKENMEIITKKEKQSSDIHLPKTRNRKGRKDVKSGLPTSWKTGRSSTSRSKNSYFSSVYCRLKATGETPLCFLKNFPKDD